MPSLCALLLDPTGATHRRSSDMLPRLTTSENASNDWNGLHYGPLPQCPIVLGSLPFARDIQDRQGLTGDRLPDRFLSSGSRLGRRRISAWREQSRKLQTISIPKAPASPSQA